MKDVSFLAIRNWGRLQHYKNVQRPVWIKAYSHLLDDKEDHGLPIPVRLYWRQLLLLAARYGNAIPNDPKRLGEEAHLPTRTVREGNEMLLKLGWIKETKSSRRYRSVIEPNGRRRTGWKFVRGTHGGTYKPDPEGTDFPPYAARNATTRVLLGE